MSIKIRLDELAKKIEAQLYGDGEIFINNVSSINKAKSGDIVFLKDRRFRDQLCSCNASAVILSKENLNFRCLIAALVVDNPYLAYVKIASLFNDVSIKLNSHSITLGSVIGSDVILGVGVRIGDNVIIESGVVLNDNVQIGSGSFIGKNTKIGFGSCLLPHVTIYHEIEIGEYCVIQSGAVIGSDGFGYIKNSDIWIKVPQLGKVKIGNNVEIGASTTIDRGTLDDTQIEDGVVIDNQCQIAHNVIIGKNTAVAGGVIIAGSVIVGKNCMIGGASVINGHISICDQVIITGMSMVIKSIKIPGIYSSGMPVQPNFVWRKNTVLLRKIRYINKRIKVLEDHIKKFFYIKIIGTVCFCIFIGLIGLLLLIWFLFNQE